MKRLIGATLNTFRGFRHAARSEVALRQELAIVVIALPVGFFLAPGMGWYVAMIGALLAILAVELLNTAIEKLADHVTSERHPAIGAVKDMGSAAVFCALLLAAVIWSAAALQKFAVIWS